MALRTLRRKVIIREYDFIKVRDQAFAPLARFGIPAGMSNTLYDRAEFVPLTKNELEMQNLIHVLKKADNDNPLKPTGIPAVFLYNAKDYLYSSKYIDYNPEYDEDGYIWVQARKNTPRSRLGWGIFEKDLVLSSVK